MWFKFKNQRLMKKWWWVGLIVCGSGISWVFWAHTVVLSAVPYSLVITPVYVEDRAPVEAPTPAFPDAYTGLANPAIGQTLHGTAEDPLSGFSRRPLDRFSIPPGGGFLDEQGDGLHYGVDYTNPDDYLNGRPIYFYPIGPGYVTARSSCVKCFVDGIWRGQVKNRWPQYNFGWGGFVLVETPYNAAVSIYVMYAHLDRDFVSLGDYVTPDEVLGVVGSSGYSEEVHVHTEVRYGAPGRFWNADFSHPKTLERWLMTMFVSPALLILPENHPMFVATLEEWTTR